MVMAHFPPDWTGRLRCSYKSATFILCTGNVLMALFMLHAALSPVSYFESASSPGASSSSSSSSSSTGLDGRMVPTQEELERIEDSNRLRRELLPFHLIERVREIQEETELEIQKTEALNLARQKVAAELSERLRELKLSNSESTQKGGEEKALDSRVQILGDLQKHSNGASTEKVDMAEHDIIPGRAVPPECHAEANTDYAGSAIRWGLTHHVDSAADCCQACLDQAKSATEGKKKCNIWVYCPSEGGCYSPDKYTHKSHECWLKQADDPVINFKGHYDEDFRQQHSTAPSIVPWVSGVVS